MVVMQRFAVPVLSAVLVCIHLLSSAPPSPGSGAAPQSDHPNEMGRVMILEYHLIQPAETRWGRSIANFKHDLDLLYQTGFRPIGMADYLDGKISLPVGTKPFILTFDDSSDGQFRYLNKNGRPEIDPDCAVGILLSFHTAHPDFELKGIFFVLPGAKEPHKLFGQPEYEAQKLKQLVALGFEIGNHTLWHADLAKYGAAVVQEQLARAVEAIQKMVPGYRMRALALPLGDYPKDPQLAVAGSYRGISYHNEAILMVSGPAALSPFSIRRDLIHLPRIQVTGKELQRRIAYYGTHPAEVFSSDGNAATVTCPQSLRSEFNATKFGGLRIITYAP